MAAGRNAIASPGRSGPPCSSGNPRGWIAWPEPGPLQRSSSASASVRLGRGARDMGPGGLVPRMPRWLSGLLATVELVTAVSGLLGLLAPHAPVLSLSVSICWRSCRWHRLGCQAGGGGVAGVDHGLRVPVRASGGIPGDHRLALCAGPWPAARRSRSSWSLRPRTGSLSRWRWRPTTWSRSADEHHQARVRLACAGGFEQRDGVLRLSVGDDGVGGAEPAGGSGLIGLRDRVEALGG
jgi:hypothetical protein